MHESKIKKSFVRPTMVTFMVSLTDVKLWYGTIKVFSDQHLADSQD